MDRAAEIFMATRDKAVLAEIHKLEGVTALVCAGMVYHAKRCGALLIVLLLAAGQLFPAHCNAGTGATSSAVASLLRQARWSHEPSALIVQAVELLDVSLDEYPQNKHMWKQLAEALAIGNANSRHAPSAKQAWHRAYKLDQTDCHTGALATPLGLAEAAGDWIEQLNQNHPNCPEALYLRALGSATGSAEKIGLLRDSLAQRQSADAMVTLAQQLVLLGDVREAAKKYSAALTSPALFPEDWRPDGRVAVHAHLGLAWLHFSSGNTKMARREYKIFLSWFLEPGPWHDLSEAEMHWHDKLDGILRANFSRQGLPKEIND
jgi:tetratricopeptide (TPR) repeat protein